MRRKKRTTRVYVKCLCFFLPHDTHIPQSPQTHLNSHLYIVSLDGATGHVSLPLTVETIRLSAAFKLSRTSFSSFPPLFLGREAGECRCIVTLSTVSSLRKRSFCAQLGEENSTKRLTVAVDTYESYSTESKETRPKWCRDGGGASGMGGGALGN